MMVTFPQSVIGCPLPDGYSYGQNQSSSAVPTLKGRSRHQLRDTKATTLVSISFLLTYSQFNGWQSFWAAINKGADWFMMDLVLDDTLSMPYQCHAVDAYEAQAVDDVKWSVNIQLEVVTG